MTEVPPPGLLYDETVDIETRQRVEHILARVKRAAETRSLEDLGRSTMGESVALMDLGDNISPVIIKTLKSSRNWKYRFWLVDMLGFVGGEGNIIPLIEIIEDNTEKLEVRMRACESLKELRLGEAIPYLLVARELVSDERILGEIQQAIEYLR